MESGYWGRYGEQIGDDPQRLHKLLASRDDKQHRAI